MRSLTPISKSISVVAGMSEMMRRGAADLSGPESGASSVREPQGRTKDTESQEGPHYKEQEGGDQAWRNSSHRKNGPPMSAVTMPTGNSVGANTIRATRSQPIRNDAPNSADAGSTTR